MTMSLDLVPRSHSKLSAGFPDGMTHRKTDPCPFANDHPVGTRRSCCAYVAKAVALYLIGLGLGPLAARLFQEKDPEECIAFARELQGCIDRFKTFIVRATHAIDQEGETDEETIAQAIMGVPEVDWDIQAKDALDALGAVAEWHERLGHMNFGVRAWSDFVAKAA